MRLDLREIIHVPGASLPFSFQLDLSQEEFFGEHPIPRPVTVEGSVKNIADVLVLEGEAKSLLDYTCDRCMSGFSREKTVPLSFLLAETLEGEDDGEIVLLGLPGVCPAGRRRDRRGRTGLHGVHSRYGHKTSMLRRLQGALPRLWREPESGALPVQEAGRSQMGRTRAAT